MKKMGRIALVVLVSLLLCITAFADNTDKLEYTEDTFADVPATEWYAEDVETSYELNLMSGVSANLFAPNDEVTVAEAITVCVRALALYGGEEISVSTTGNWYDSYVEYAIEKGFVQEGQFDSYTRAITRSEMAEVFFDAMPDGFYKRIKYVEDIPDVSDSADYFSKLLKLYNAGVITGKDDYGTFGPNESLKRSELTAIINRVAVEENRVKDALKSLGATEKPDTIYHIDDEGTMSKGHGTGLVSGWDYVDLYSNINFDDKKTNTLTDIYSSSGIYIKRKITPISSGEFQLDVVASNNNINGGFYIQLTDENLSDIIRVYGKNGTYHIKSGDYSFDTGEAITRTVMLTLEGNFDNKSADLYINSKIVSSFDFSDAYSEITYLYIGTEDDAKLVFAPSSVILTSNYLIRDGFLTVQEGASAENWEINDRNFVAKSVSGSTALSVEAKENKNSSAKKNFTPSSGNIAFEVKMHSDKSVSGRYVSIKSGDTEVFRVSTEGNDFVSPYGDVLRTHLDNVWQLIRLEANTDTDKVFVKINGKKIGEFDFINKVSYIDSIEIGITPDEDTVFTFDDVNVFTLHEYDDYVPKPIPAKSTNYDIGITMCSLWRNGSAQGWETLTNFPELETVLGYYDEGNPEVADWEIKFLVEHGVDFEHLCWYCPANGDIQHPIKTNIDALHDGFFNAKYSDMMKFCIMWENSLADVKSLEQFKKYIWPFWVEYYFTDPRYMTVENKPILTVWTYGSFLNAFKEDAEGDAAYAKAREAVAFMNEDLKKYGYDGLVLLFNDVHTESADVLTKMKNLGGDGTFSYSLGYSGNDPEYQKNRYTNQRATGVLHNTPALGVGFNNVGWNSSSRHPLITLEDYEEVARFYRDEYLPQTANDEESWHSRLMFLSTWNEYGEGHYIMPCAEHEGFGYLDVVRKIFTSDPETAQSNTVPTAAQKARINELFPQDRSIIDRTGYKTLRTPEDFASGYSVYHKLDLTQSMVTTVNYSLSSLSVSNGVVKATSRGSDHYVFTKAFELDSNIAKAIHVRAKTNGGSGYMEIFFTTDSQTQHTQTHSKSVKYPAIGEWVDLYFDMEDVAGWTGTITSLRLDVNTGAGVTTEVSCIEFLTRNKGIRVDVIIDGEDITAKLPFDNVIENNSTVMVIVEPGSGVFSRLGLYNEYSRHTKTLMLMSRDHKLVMTEGSNVAVFDGNNVTMPFTYTVYDGLPKICLQYIARLFGHTVNVVDGAIRITTQNSVRLEALKGIEAYEYDFDISGYTEDWVSDSGTLTMQEGNLVISNTEGAPSLISPTMFIHANRYKTVEVRMKWDVASKYQNSLGSMLNFNTLNSTSLENNSRSVSKSLTGLTKDSEGYVTLTFNMYNSSSLWRNQVYKLKFMPINVPGTVYIDYIRFIADESVADTYATTMIRNGDAEDLTRNYFGDSSATATIVTDPLDPTNHCYLVESLGRDKSAYTYFTQSVIFEPGSTYLFEFDYKPKCYNGDTTLTEKEKNSVTGCAVNMNILYEDGYTSKNHLALAGSASYNTGWTHAALTMTISPDMEGRTQAASKFSVYSNPHTINGKSYGIDYYVDNVKMTKIG